MIIVLLAAYGTSCEKIFLDADPANTPLSNFEMLWNTLDSKYALFPYKEIDWDSIYRVYRPMISDEMHDTTLFQILGNMLLELRDSHTDISSPFKKIYYDYSAGFPDNFIREIVSIGYLGKRSQAKNGISYNKFNSVGYMIIPTFSEDISDEDVREILDYFSDAKGIIIDVRQNSGGKDLNTKIIANHFFDKKRKVEIRHYKTGPAHDDFGIVDFYVEPKRSLQITKPTVILTNRKCYSACNSFVCWMSVLPHVLVVGDTTGGGGSTPLYSELPNGWVYRYSSNAAFRPDGLNIDEGIPPDSIVYLKPRDSANFRDTMIEFAIDYIHSQVE